MYAEYTQSVLEILSYPESTMGQVCWGPVKILKIKVHRKLESAI